MTQNSFRKSTKLIRFTRPLSKEYTIKTAESFSEKPSCKEEHVSQWDANVFSVDTAQVQATKRTWTRTAAWKNQKPARLPGRGLDQLSAIARVLSIH